MKDLQFYPTPYEIASKMVEPYIDLIKKGAFVLDPSAGKGDLLKAAKYYCPDSYPRTQKCLAIEIDQERRLILSQNHFKVIGEDFLAYNSKFHVDIILMNPPFNDAENHLLKAWEILDKGHIACLINSETYLNPFSAKRELIKSKIDNFGTIEHLGPVFPGVSADVSLVRLTKNKDTKDLFYFNPTPSAFQDFTEETINNHSLPANNDVISSLLKSFEGIHDALRRKIQAEAELEAATKDFMAGFYIQENDRDRLNRMSGAEAYNEWLTWYNKAAWFQVFERAKAFKAMMTTEVKKNFDKFMDQSQSMEFNHANVINMIDMLVVNRNQILADCILDTFDRLTKYDSKNKVHWEGWKTNDSYKVNRTVILPYMVSNYFNWIEHEKLNYLEDIDRAMCAIEGINYGELSQRSPKGSLSTETIVGAIQNDLSLKPHQIRVGESRFFKWKYFLKGTIHLTFKDESLWMRFNRFVADKKGWLPDNVRITDEALKSGIEFSYTDPFKEIECIAFFMAENATGKPYKILFNGVLHSFKTFPSLKKNLDDFKSKHNLS